MVLDFFSIYFCLVSSRRLKSHLWPMTFGRGARRHKFVVNPRILALKASPSQLLVSVPSLFYLLWMSSIETWLPLSFFGWNVDWRFSPSSAMFEITSVGTNSCCPIDLLPPMLSFADWLLSLVLSLRGSTTKKPCLGDFSVYHHIYGQSVDIYGQSVIY